jgi:hypothetical protein
VKKRQLNIIKLTIGRKFYVSNDKNKELGRHDTLQKQESKTPEMDQIPVQFNRHA